MFRARAVATKNFAPKSTAYARPALYLHPYTCVRAELGRPLCTYNMSRSLRKVTNCMQCSRPCQLIQGCKYRCMYIALLSFVIIYPLSGVYTHRLHYMCHSFASLHNSAGMHTVDYAYHMVGTNICEGGNFFFFSLALSVTIHTRNYTLYIKRLKRGVDYLPC